MTKPSEELLLPTERIGGMPWRFLLILGLALAGAVLSMALLASPGTSEGCGGTTPAPRATPTTYGPPDPERYRGIPDTGYRPDPDVMVR